MICRWAVNVVAAALVSTTGLGASAIQSPSTLPTHIVTLRPGIDSEALAREHGVVPAAVYRHALLGFAATLPAGLIQNIKRDNRVLAVEPNGPIFSAGQTISTGVRRMGITTFPLAHINRVDERINLDVAILDTGIQLNHPDLNVFQAAGFADPGLNGDDWSGHGTHVAGIIGALDNEIGVVGVAPGVRLWSVQVLGPTQSGWNSFLAGMDYIAQHTGEISVVNASLSNNGIGPAPRAAIESAISNLVSQGVVFVTCAGNGAADVYGPDGLYGTDDDYLPAAIPEAMTVSTVEDTDGASGNDRLAATSCYSQSITSRHFVNSPGAAIDVAAPGVTVYSTWRGSSYANLSGGSMACAHASGLVALYIAANGRGTNAAGVYQTRQALVDHAQPQTAWLSGNTFDPDTNHEGLAVASTDWIPQMRFIAQQLQPTGFYMTFTTLPGYQYTLQCSDGISPSSNWLDFVCTNGVGSAITLGVPFSAPVRFFRVLSSPMP